MTMTMMVLLGMASDPAITLAPPPTGKTFHPVHHSILAPLTTNEWRKDDMTIIITDKEDDIPSEHLFLTDSVTNHLMMVQTDSWLNPSFRCLAKQFAKQNPDQWHFSNFQNHYRSHITAVHLPSAHPSLKRKIMYGGEKGDPFPLLLPCLKSKL